MRSGIFFFWLFVCFMSNLLLYWYNLVIKWPQNVGASFIAFQFSKSSQLCKRCEWGTECYITVFNKWIKDVAWCITFMYLKALCEDLPTFRVKIAKRTKKNRWMKTHYYHFDILGVDIDVVQIFSITYQIGIAYIAQHPA